MITFIALRIRRRLWRRFHWLVRFGWFVATGAFLGIRRETWEQYPQVRRLGIGMMAAGLIIGKPKKVLLYSATVPADHSVRVRVVQNGRTIAAG